MKQRYYRGDHPSKESNQPPIRSVSLSVSPVAPTLEHRASVKRFVSLQFLNPQSVGLLGWGISPSQDRYLYEHRVNTNIHALSGIRTHDPSFRAGKASYKIDSFRLILTGTRLEGLLLKTLL
jgi:hypothetical protein